MINVYASVKIMCKNNYSWNPSVCIFEDSRYLKSIVDNSVIVCDEVIDVMDSASRLSINSDDKKLTHKNNCLIHTILLIIICLLLLVDIYIRCYYYYTRH